jgi:hypothetical protein
MSYKSRKGHREDTEEGKAEEKDKSSREAQQERKERLGKKDK